MLSGIHSSDLSHLKKRDILHSRIEIERQKEGLDFNDDTKYTKVDENYTDEKFLMTSIVFSNYIYLRNFLFLSNLWDGVVSSETCSKLL